MITASIVVSSSRPKTVIIGAGVMGLGIAWRLAQAGCPVTVYDRAEAGRGASWAAAGMLAAAVETEPGEEALLALTLESQRMWPDFARELEAASGVSVGYRDEGTIVVALTRDDAEQLRFTFEFQKGLGLDLEWLSGAEARRREPHLRAGHRRRGAEPARPSGRKQRTRAWRSPRRSATPAPCSTSTARSARSRFPAAGRAGSAPIAAANRPMSSYWPPEPGRARSAAFRPNIFRRCARSRGRCWRCAWIPRRRCCAMCIWLPRGYLVPRLDGRLVIGGTVEERGFDEALTAGGLLALIEGAWRAVPAIEELAIAETWVGFRPGSRDDAPMLGPSGIDGLVVATGHHRNGILLTPVTAGRDQRLCVDRTATRDGPAVHPERFSDTPPSRPTAPASRGGAMTRLRINGVEEEVAATTVASCSPIAASIPRRGFSRSPSTAR